MLTELADIIDRQFRYVLAQEGELFVRDLRRTLDLLQRTPRAKALIDAEREDAIAFTRNFLAEDDARIERLIRLRAEFRTLAPDLEEPRKSPEDPQDQFFRDYGWPSFDALAQARSFQATTSSLDKTRFERLALSFRVMRGRAQYMPRKDDGEPVAVDRFHSIRPELGDVIDAFVEVEREHRKAWRRFFDRAQTDSGCALLYIERVFDRIGDPGYWHFGQSSELDLIHDSLPTPWSFDLEKLLYVEDARTDAEVRERAIEGIRHLRQAAERVHNGLLLRIGTRRSLLAVFKRFQARCQWHDRGRLLEVADQSGEAPEQENRPKRSKAEQALTEELARYLFDQGLDPLTEVPMAGLRPDLIQPGSFYVEAKQYVEGNPRETLIRGIHQMRETMGRIQSSANEVTEGFYIVFRRGGPRVDFEFEAEGLRFETWTLRPLLVDIAPAAISGSRARASILITEADVRAKVSDAKPPPTTSDREDARRAR